MLILSNSQTSLVYFTPTYPQKISCIRSLKCKISVEIRVTKKSRRYASIYVSKYQFLKFGFQNFGDFVRCFLKMFELTSMFLNVTIDLNLVVKPVDAHEDVS